jgi:hypothetical protein
VCARSVQGAPRVRSAATGSGPKVDTDRHDLGDTIQVSYRKHFRSPKNLNQSGIPMSQVPNDALSPVRTKKRRACNGVPTACVRGGLPPMHSTLPEPVARFAVLSTMNKVVTDRSHLRACVSSFQRDGHYADKQQLRVRLLVQCSADSGALECAACTSASMPRQILRAPHL